MSREYVASSHGFPFQPKGWGFLHPRIGTPPALGRGMSKKRNSKKLIWAYDPFEGKGGSRGKVASALAYLGEKVKLDVQPVYVLSPAAVSLQAPFSQSQAAQYLLSAEEVMRTSLKGNHVPGLGKPEVIVQPTELMRNAVTAFLSYAKSKHAELIVVGTHANRGLSRLLLGSFTETLILHSRIPVLAVNPKVKARPVRHILFPTDLSPQSKVFFKKTCGLARELGAKVTLLHVIPHPLTPFFQSGAYLIGGGWMSIPEFMTAAEERARGVAEQWVKEASSGGVIVSVAFDSGSKGVRQSVLAHAKKVNAGLIAMGAESGPVETALLGSVVRQVVRESSCPVWIMRK